ncbi:MAG: hypothetical protein EXR67_06160 [Dehalococcoidia bacterium]|nr:hypothetical protein [Dehalococcoidia bacterium]
MRERYREEIEEILAGHVGKFGSKGVRRRHGLWQRVSSLRFWNIFSPGRILVTSLILILGALLVRGAAPDVMTVVFWLGLIGFIAAYAMFLVHWGNKADKRWRGRPVRDSNKTAWFDRWKKNFRFRN